MINEKGKVPAMALFHSHPFWVRDFHGSEQTSQEDSFGGEGIILPLAWWHGAEVHCNLCTEVEEVTDRFLRRKATIGQVRAAVKAVSPTYERDRQYLAGTGDRPAGYSEEEIEEMEADISSQKGE
jgi:hypothetical protein